MIIELLAKSQPGRGHGQGQATGPVSRAGLSPLPEASRNVLPKRRPLTLKSHHVRCQTLQLGISLMTCSQQSSVATSHSDGGVPVPHPDHS